jgi:hypothetical protein
MGTAKANVYIDWVIAMFRLSCFDNPEGLCVDLFDCNISG